MRRTLYALVAASLIAVTVVPATAVADFHPVCEPPAAAYANVDLSVEEFDPFYESDFEYRGLVYCPEAEVTVVELELLVYPGYGAPDQVANTTADPCTPTVTEPCAVQDTAPAASGTYEVTMTFHVDDPATPGIDFENVTRSGVYFYPGFGHPVPLCVSAGVVPVQVGTCNR